MHQALFPPSCTLVPQGTGNSYLQSCKNHERIYSRVSRDMAMFSSHTICLELVQTTANCLRHCVVAHATHISKTVAHVQKQYDI